MDSSTQPAQTGFPSIYQLFKEAWGNLITRLLPLLIFNCLAIISLIVLASIPFGAFVYFASNLDSTSSIITSLITMAISFAGFVVIYIGSLLVLNSNYLQISYKSLFKQILAALPSVILALIIILFIVLGGFVLLIIPGVIFSILLQFVVFYLVLDKLSLRDSIKSSIYIASRSFGYIFVRLCLIALIPFIFNTLVGFFSIYSLDETSLALVEGIFSLIYSFFALSYGVILFKHAKAYSGQGSSTKLRLIILISVVGWIVGVVLTYSLSAYVSQLPISLDPSLTEDLGSDVVEDFDFEDAAPDDLFESPIPSATSSAKPSAPKAATGSANLR